MTPVRPPRPTDSAITPTAIDDTVDRRQFLTVASLGAGLLLAGACSTDEEIVPGLLAKKRGGILTRTGARVVVVGAGAFGGWTAYHLRRAGADVTLVDIWGPGNGRSTSGDETRGVRSSYGERETGELWMLWAREAMGRWQKWDEEWSKDLKTNLFHTSGDVIMRTDWDNLTKNTKALWEKHKIPHESVTGEEARKRWPVFKADDITVAIYEPDAGIVRARRSVQTVAAAFEKIGGKIKIGRATITKKTNGKVDEVTLSTGEKLTADVFVFACGPWMAKVFPEILADKMRLPMGYVCYFATPAGDERFRHPNMPSFNFPGVTGWPALPVDSRGLRVRGGSRAPAPGAGAVAGRGGPADGRGGTGRGGRGRGGTGRGGGGGRRGAGVAAGRGGAQNTSANQAPVNPNQNDPDLSDRWADPARLEGPRNFLAQRIPLMKDMPLNETRACHYESTSTSNFMIDKHPQLSNVWIAGGGNAEGFKFGPVIGEYVTQRVLGDEGDPAVAKVFLLPPKTFQQITDERAAQAAADSVAGRGRGQSTAPARGGGRGGDFQDFDEDEE